MGQYNEELDKQLRIEFATLMAGLKSNYPNWCFDLQDKAMLRFWYDSLIDIPMDVLKVGIHKLIAQEEFYPNIAKIRKACAEVINGPGVDETEAWGLVKRAIRNYGYSRPDEAYASLPIEVVQAIQSMGGWLEICSSENDEADRAHFYRSMKAINKRKEDSNVLSIGVHEQMSLLLQPREQVVAYIAHDDRYKKQPEEVAQIGMAKIKNILNSIEVGA